MEGPECLIAATYQIMGYLLIEMVYPGLKVRVGLVPGRSRPESQPTGRVLKPISALVRVLTRQETNAHGDFHF